jgi:hypothetical protein
MAFGAGACRSSASLYFRDIFRDSACKLINGESIMNSGRVHTEQPARSDLMRSQPFLFAFLLTISLAIICVLLVFYEGLRRGMDHVTMFGPENEQAAIAIALSDVVYNLNGGYVGYASVFRKLVEVWNRGAKSPHDPIVIENSSDRRLLNDAIRTAASLGPQAPGFVADGSLITMIYTDIGQVDFSKLAFRIFGLTIESRYYMFFLLILASAVFYLLVFWNSPICWIVLLCTLFSFYIELHTSVFTINMPTFSSERHGSALALIPLWHFTFLLIQRKRPSFMTFICTVAQLSILLLAVKIRGAAIWMVLFVVTVLVALSANYLRQLNSEPRRWRRLSRLTTTWPVVLLVAGMVLSNEYTKAKLHPVYFTDDVMPYHGLWQSAFVGLMMLPDMIPQDSKALEVARTMGDDAAHGAATLEYLNEVHFAPLPPDYPRSMHPSLVSPWTGTYKTKLFDDVMRRVVIRALAGNPIGMLKLYFYVKPQAIIDTVTKVLSPNLTWFWLLLFGGIVITGITFPVGTNITGLQLIGSLLIIGSAIPFAALPSLWAFPSSYSITDLLLIVLVFAQIAIGAVGLSIMRRLSSRICKSPPL